MPKWPFVKRSLFEDLERCYDDVLDLANRRLEKIQALTDQRDRYADERNRAEERMRNAETLAYDKVKRVEYLENKIHAIETCLEFGPFSVDATGERPKVTLDLPKEFR